MNDQREGTRMGTAEMLAAANGNGAAQEAPPPVAQPGSNEPAVESQTTPAGHGGGATGSQMLQNGAGGANAAAKPGSGSSLFTEQDTGQLRSRWEAIQTGFVDEPRQAVEQADQLVVEVMKRLAELFAEERQGLEAQWNRGDAADTEALRMALQRYRTFFQRLLST